MTNPGCILAATDLTEQSRHVAGRGARLAQKFDAPLMLIHVRDAAKPLDQAQTAALRAQAQTHGATVHVLSGDPASVLAGFAKDHGAQVMVLGLHSERRVMDALRLTTLERIVLHAPCAALIAHRPPDAPYRQVLGITDFSNASAQALVMARRVAPFAAFHAVHALESPLGALFNPKLRAERALQAERDRDLFLQTPGLPLLDDPLEIIPGGVHEVLSFRRNELNADLVCMGVHSGRDPKVLGHYTRDLMRAPPTDLLLGRPVVLRDEARDNANATERAD